MHPVRVQADGKGSVVFQRHLDAVADLGAQDRAEDAGVLPRRGARLQLGEGVVRVFAKNGLLENRRLAVLPAF